MCPARRLLFDSPADYVRSHVPLGRAHPLINASFRTDGAACWPTLPWQYYGLGPMARPGAKVEVAQLFAKFFDVRRPAHVAFASELAAFVNRANIPSDAAMLRWLARAPFSATEMAACFPLDRDYVWKAILHEPDLLLHEISGRFGRQQIWITACATTIQARWRGVRVRASTFVHSGGGWPLGARPPGAPAVRDKLGAAIVLEKQRFEENPATRAWTRHYKQHQQ
jgi:hypothetical protein